MAHIINRFQSFKGEINDTSYQPMQALIAIGSGVEWGRSDMGVQKYELFARGSGVMFRYHL